ncbi:MAG: Tfp pilus assembly protein FimT/FimU [Nitrospiria bacterium]
MKRFLKGFSSGRMGFTLVELLFVIIIFSLSVALVAPAISRSLGTSQARVTARNIVAQLNDARNISMRQRENVYVEVFLDKVVLTAGDKRDFKKSIPLPEHITVNASENPIMFFPGGDSIGGAFEVREEMNKTGYVIRIEASTGRVRVSPL